jgi:hypothetical protein
MARIDQVDLKSMFNKTRCNEVEKCIILLYLSSILMLRLRLLGGVRPLQCYQEIARLFPRHLFYN